MCKKYGRQSFAHNDIHVVVSSCFLWQFILEFRIEKYCQWYCSSLDIKKPITAVTEYRIYGAAYECLVATEMEFDETEDVFLHSEMYIFLSMVFLDL